jgi:hypothetical protein
LRRDRIKLFKRIELGLDFANERINHLDKGDHAFFNELFNDENVGTELQEKASDGPQT